LIVVLLSNQSLLLPDYLPLLLKQKMNEVHKLLPPKTKKKTTTTIEYKYKKHTEPTTHNNIAIGKGFPPSPPSSPPIGLADHSKETIQHSSF